MEGTIEYFVLETQLVPAVAFESVCMVVIMYRQTLDS